MKTKKVNRYYCEHCTKSGCNAGHIKAHEKKCCKNPGRACEMCGTEKRDYKDLCKQFEAEGGNTDALAEWVEGCPWCMLAVILQCTKNLEGTWEWDFKAEKEQWFAERIAAEQEADARFVNTD